MSLLQSFRTFKGSWEMKKKLIREKIPVANSAEIRARFLKALQSHKLRMSDPNDWFTDEEFEALVSEESKRVLIKTASDVDGSN
jgi:hypothetical protein